MRNRFTVVFLAVVCISGSALAQEVQPAAGNPLCPLICPKLQAADEGAALPEPADRLRIAGVHNAAENPELTLDCFLDFVLAFEYFLQGSILMSDYLNGSGEPEALVYASLTFFIAAGWYSDFLDCYEE